MQIKSNLQYIQFTASAEDSEQQYGKLQIGITHEDFMLSLMLSLAFWRRTISASMSEMPIPFG